MKLSVRELQPDEVDVVVDYFHEATPEFLDMLGVDPTRLPPRAEWGEMMRADIARSLGERDRFALAWLADGAVVGFSTCDKIVLGEQARMHLHILQANNRQRGIGEQCVRLSVDIYFEQLKLKTLYCEPNAFNVAPNRTLQKVGFKYAKTHMTVPGALNYRQPVTRWVIERP